MSFAYMPFYTGDYHRDTRHLSMLQHGAYRLLLDHCWDQRGPLPLDLTKCYRICGAVSKEEQDAVRAVIEEFFIRMDDGHYNGRMQREVERAHAISAARSDAGRRGYEAKAKQLPSKSQASAGQLPLSPPPSPEPIQLNTATTDVVACPPPASRHPDCPHVQVLALWAEMLPHLPQHDPAQWRGSRADHLRARWRETAATKGWKAQEQGLTYFRKLFGYVGQSPFLTGQDHAKDRRPFFAELAWLVEPLNWAKVHEGKYHQTEKA